MSGRITAIWWIRRDLRLADNLALTAAAALGSAVVPVFVLDPAVLEAPYHRAAEKRKSFLFHGLAELDRELHEHGSRLIVRHGQALAALAALAGETGAQRIFACADFSPYGSRRDAQVAQHLPLTLVNDVTIQHPAAVHKADGEPYTVFTPFSRAWRALPAPSFAPAPMPGHLHTPAQLASAELPAAEPLTHFLPGEQHAAETLRSFVTGSEAPIDDYAQGRNLLAVDGTSALSPYLRFGMLSARAAYAAGEQAAARAPTAAARAGAEVWLNELIWREFYIAVLHHFPHVRQQAFRSDLRAIAWRNDAGDFAAWREGRTGYPVVDAAMRQLAVTGWMHNRARMITASFLVKDLLIDWRWGEAWFMQHLVDGDPAANNGGWQWTAGVGTDAAPFFRVFNPTTQATCYDPYGAFARAWLPELHGVPDAFVHEPWRMPSEVQREAQCLIGRDYPAPIVEHAFARQRALEAYRVARLA